MRGHPWGSAGALSAACLAGFFITSAASAHPITLVVGEQHTPSELFGPADMLCDLNKCRMFNLPDRAGLPPDTIVEFGLPEMQGQYRIALRHCIEALCRASVLGFASEPTSAPGHSRPTLFITPIEMRLE